MQTTYYENDKERKSPMQTIHVLLRKMFASDDSILTVAPL